MRENTVKQVQYAQVLNMLFFFNLPPVLVSDLLSKREGHAITLFANYSQISLQLCLFQHYSAWALIRFPRLSWLYWYIKKD